MCSTSSTRSARSKVTPTASKRTSAETAGLTLLAGVDGEDRALGSEGRSPAAGLDLEEDQGAAVAGDDVELAVTGPGVALDDLPAGGGEAAGDQLLRLGTGSLASNRHPRGR